MLPDPSWSWWNSWTGRDLFDDQNDRDADKIFGFCEDAVNSVIKAFDPIIEKHKNDEFTPTQKEWQDLMRRGRCVEFNLVYDRGTVFGLKTGGRVESILMSLPKIAGWEQYDFASSWGGQCRGWLYSCKQESKRMGLSSFIKSVEQRILGTKMWTAVIYQ